MVRKARKKLRQPEVKPHALLPHDLRAILLMEKHITKCLYGQDSEYNISLRVVGVALRM
jgi:hypothetical protein